MCYFVDNCCDRRLRTFVNGFPYSAFSACKVAYLPSYIIVWYWLECYGLRKKGNVVGGLDTP